MIDLWQHPYCFEEQSQVSSPALIYYPDILQQNLAQVLTDADGAKRLWPHVKSHKMAALIRMQLEAGIQRFKCATLAEAGLAASCGAEHVLLAYPLVGPAIAGFLRLAASYPSTCFWAIGDNLATLEELGRTAAGCGQTVPVLVDVNPGMNRTGVLCGQLPAFYQKASSLPGLSLRGIHYYDGNRTEKDFAARKQAVLFAEETLHRMSEAIRANGFCCDTAVLGGSPTMSCYRGLLEHYPHAYLSPGTLFVYDWGYSVKYPDLAYTPAAAVLTRVISHPAPGYFTLDLGYKAISTDQPGSSGLLLSVPYAREAFQSEEHWTFCMEEGHEDKRPALGSELFVLPTHICSTTALYSSVITVKQHHLCGQWDVTARDRGSALYQKGDSYEQHL